MELKLDTPLQFLRGVGPRRAEALSVAGLDTVRDLLLYFPRRYVDRSAVTPVTQLEAGREATVIGHIRASGMLRGKRSRFEATLDDGHGHLQLVFFHQPRRFASVLKKGTYIACTGTPLVYLELQMVHPEFEILDSEDAPLGPDRGRIVPVYPGTAEMSSARVESRLLRRLIQPLTESGLPDQVEDPLPPDWCERLDLPATGAALRWIHFPDSLDQADRARRRFAFDELLAIQIHLAQRRSQRARVTKPHSFQSPGPPERQLLDSLPFALTGDQKKAVRDIMADMTSPVPMQRLLQGDVGAGKTVVAAFALYLAVRSGYQAAIMAPTEILAEQHQATLTRLFEPVDVRPVLLTGSRPAAERRTIAEGLSDGSIRLVVGTHALIQSSVSYERLALAVVDEQHRFGVHQRARLATGGRGTDVLVMTATPIPRTLQLTLYGDLDLSTLRELPPGRAPVTTKRIDTKELPTLWRWLDDRIERHDQAYVVYPIIEESEKQDLKAATREFERLSKEQFPKRRVALLHGRTPADERRDIMQAFRDGTVDILVATTVIEIGVDVPNANIMIIEHAERFGLSQLHQLRGRIRRSSKHGYCVAVSAGTHDVGNERLAQFVATDDGFEIAEADLRLRGPGEIVGLRQHGVPGLHVADLGADTDLLELARREATTLCRQDPQLTDARWATMRQSVERARAYWSAG